MTVTEEKVKSLDAADTAALVVPATELAVLMVTGGDRLSWLNGVVTCNLANRAPGDAVYGLAVTPKGRILADLLVVVEVDAVTLVVPAAQREELRLWCEKYLIMEDAEIVAAEERVWRVAGPRSAEVVRAARAAGARGGLVTLAGGEGAVIVARSAAVPEVNAAVDGALAGMGGARGDEATWETLRVLRAVPAYPVDFDGSTYPQEAGLEKRAVAFDKGCYLGQEVVCMLEMRGHVKRKLVQLRLEGGVRPGVDVFHEGKDVGQVTSVTVDPRTGAGFALAMVKRAVAEPGTRMRVGDALAEVVRAT